MVATWDRDWQREWIESFFFHGVLNGDHRVRVLSPDHRGPMYGVFANILLMFFNGFQCSSR